MPLDFTHLESIETGTPLHQPMLAHEQGQDVPSLFVGLGGTGTETVARVKQYYSGLAAGGNAPTAGFLCVDVVPFEYQPEFVRASIDSGIEYDSLVDDSQQSLRQWANAQQRIMGSRYDDMFDWYDESWPLPPAQFDAAGAGGVRQVGRFAFARSLNDLERKFVNVMTPLLAPTVAGNAVAAGRLNVFVIAGACGGTGSGVFVDTVRLIHKVYRLFNQQGDPSIRAFLVLPTLYERSCTAAGRIDLARRQKPNGFAALKELDYLLCPTTSTRDMDEVTLPQFAGTQGPDGAGGFVTMCYLVDDIVPGRAGNISNRRAMVGLLAEAIATLGLTSAGDADEAQVVDALGCLTRMSMSGHRTAYSGLGIIRAIAPTWSIAKFHARRLLHDVVRHQLCGDSASGQAEALQADMASGRLQGVYMELLAPLGAIDQKLAAAGQAIPRPDAEGLASAKGDRWLADIQTARDNVHGASSRYQAQLERECLEVIREGVAKVDPVVTQYVDGCDEGLTYAYSALDRLEEECDALLARLVEEYNRTNVSPGRSDQDLYDDARAHQRNVLVRMVAPGRKRDISRDIGDALTAEAQRNLMLVALRAKIAYLSELSEVGVMSESVSERGLFEFKRGEALLDSAQTKVKRAKRDALAVADVALSRARTFELEDIDGSLTPSTLLYPKYLREDVETQEPKNLLGIYRDCIFSGDRAELRAVTVRILQDLRASGASLLQFAEGDGPSRAVAARMLRICAEYVQESLTSAKARAAYGDSAMPEDLYVAAQADGVSISQLLAELMGNPQPQLAFVPDANFPPEPVVTLCVHDVQVVPQGVAPRVVGGVRPQEAVLLLGTHGIALEALERMYEMRDRYRSYKGAEPLHIGKTIAKDLPDPLANESASFDEEVFEALIYGLFAGLVLRNADSYEPGRLVRVPAGIPMPDRLPAPISKRADGMYVLAPYRLEEGKSKPLVLAVGDPDRELGLTLYEALMALGQMHGSVRGAARLMCELVGDTAGGLFSARQLAKATDIQLASLDEMLENAIDDKAEAQVIQRLIAEFRGFRAWQEGRTRSHELDSEMRSALSDDAD